MKANIVVIAICMLLGSCTQQSKQADLTRQEVSIDPPTPISADVQITDCSVVEFKSVKEQADYLITYYGKAQEAKTREIYERYFFCAFPSTFINMQELFGDGPLYTHPAGGDIIAYFQNLTTIPSVEYYEKYINICINGIWEADYVANAFGFADKLLQDTAPAITVLATKKDSEIKSVFRFIFDGPHPDHEQNQKLYQQLLAQVEAHDKRLAHLLQQAYQELLQEDDGHGL